MSPTVEPPPDPRDLDGDGWIPPEDCLEQGFAWRSDADSCSESQHVFFESPDSNGAKDFSAIEVDDELHLFYIENPGPVGVDGHETSFGHVSSQDLVHWERHPSVVPSGLPGSFQSTAVWAPQVLRVGDIWYMFYTGVQVEGELRDNRQRVGLLTSDDLVNWIPVDRQCAGAEGLGCVMTCESAFTAWGSSMPWGSDCRDAFVLRVDQTWIMFVTVRLPDGQQAIATARSANLLDWQLEHYIPRTRGQIAESPTVFLDEATAAPTWRLLWTTPFGVHHLLQRDPFQAAWTNPAFVHDGFASEILLAGANTYFYLYVDNDLRIQFERIILENDWLRFTHVVAPRCRIPASAIHPMDYDPVDGIDNNCDGVVDVVVPSEEDPEVRPRWENWGNHLRRARF